MTIAFVLINVQPGSEGKVIEKLKTFDKVKEVYGLYGIYDIMVKIETSSLEEVKETVDFKIRKLENVRSSITMIVIEKFLTG
ncbi:MAG: Lrp/AsnC ligand binding domain-containing protein [Candidatus Bathyarchaeota archaeon]|nr:Lrp/AsnC ligand binding domain-containing protein [Candidatus Bathyarchaeota archaeon]